jgi:signal transduction histidine kinase/ActR/RegA family two-component response regulator
MEPPICERGIRGTLLGCGLAVIATLLLDALWLALPGAWGERIPFSVFLFAVAGAALLGRFWAGMVAVVAGAVSGWYLGVPRFSWMLSHKADWLHIFVFLVVGTLTAFLCASLVRALEERRAALLETEARAQEEAKRLNARLAELLESERAARTNAERANRFKDEFVALVSHELRTPLNAIAGWTQLLQHSGPGPEKLERGLDVISRNTHVQERIVSDLLDLSRISAGKLSLNMSREDLRGVVEAAVEGLRGMAQAKRIDIRTELAPSDALVDPARIQQVVWNLVCNAIKFTPADGRITVSLAPDEEGRRVLRVCDTGQGIEPEFLPHLFERFRQADPSFARRHGGLGLGLAISQHLIERHGGTIEASSDGRGRGAEFVVTLPRPPVATNGVRHEAGSLEALSLTGMTILVVDDDPDAREIAQRILEERGATVMVAKSATEALAKLSAHTPSVIVSDIGMPDVDGYEFVRRLRGASGNPWSTVPAVAVTAYARTEDHDRALAVGYQGHIAKPFAAAALVSVVQYAFRSCGGSVGAS